MQLVLALAIAGRNVENNSIYMRSLDFSVYDGSIGPRGPPGPPGPTGNGLRGATGATGSLDEQDPLVLMLIQVFGKLNEIQILFQ